MPLHFNVACIVEYGRQKIPRNGNCPGYLYILPLY
jgi:hypothetical protein